ncbi:MAG: hypothetical protein GY805_04820 [Chloroflexi bacterium]|nr:hypothetical protein [Chloroflexota bacterium]
MFGVKENGRFSLKMRNGRLSLCLAVVQVRRKALPLQQTAFSPSLLALASRQWTLSWLGADGTLCLIPLMQKRLI